MLDFVPYTSFKTELGEDYTCVVAAFCREDELIGNIRLNDRNYAVYQTQETLSIARETEKNKWKRIRKRIRKQS